MTKTRMSESKSMIDRIDDMSADCFGFKDEEKEFIKRFDIEFRIRD